MKIILITDPHLVFPGNSLTGLDPAQRFRKCIEHVNEHHFDAEFAILNGDITHYGHRESYQEAKEILSQLHMPFHITIGNHDDRSVCLEVFDDIKPVKGFVQKAIETEEGCFILLDTADKGTSAGFLCEDRLHWLRMKLEETKGRPVYIFMHHPPFSVKIPALDRCKLVNDEEFYDVLAQHGSVKHIFAGHVHLPISGHWRNIPFTTILGTHQQSPVTYVGDRYVGDVQPSAYGVVFIDENSIVVHSHDYLERDLFVG